MRSSVFALFCTAAVFALLDSCTAFNSNNTFVAGARPYADKLFVREDIVQHHAGSYRRVSQTKTFVTDGKARITMVQVIDLKKNGVSTTLLSGGPGQTHVTLKFDSEVGAGIHARVEVYARY